MAALWMVLAGFLFATMGVCVKFASAHFHAFDIVFYRGLVGVLVLGAVMRHQSVAMRSPVPMMHAWRSAVGVVSLVGWFYSIGQLPLATAVTLNYMSSVWIATFLLGGAVLLNQCSVVWWVCYRACSPHWRICKWPRWHAPASPTRARFGIFLWAR